MAEYTYILTAGGPVTGSPLPPYFTFGDVAAFSLSFASGGLEAGDTLTVAIDSNMEFYDPLSATGDASIMAVAHATIPDGYDGSPVAVSVPLNTDVFRQRVNGLEKPLRVHVGFYRLRGEAYTQLGMAQGFAFPVVAGPNSVSPVLPVVDYPTREEAEALTKRSENAADRAEQAAAGIVPPLQLDAPPTTSTVGSVGQLATWHDSNATDQSKADHEYHLLYIVESAGGKEYIWREDVTENQGNVAGGYPILGVDGKVAWDQLPSMDYIPTSEKGAANGVAGLDENALVPRGRLPIAGNDSLSKGCCWFGAAVGLSSDSKGHVSIVRATNSEISARNSDHKPIVPSNLNYAVRSVLPNVTKIPAATSDYSLVDSSATTNNHSHVYSHAPTTATTYRLPQVTNTAIAHYIELTVDFTAVQTYSFLDANGDALVPLFTPSIAAGDVYTFKMEYSAIKAKWLIYPQKQGAVADDFVMRGEVGAANGVAGLDENGKVASAQLPPMNYIPISEKGVPNGVAPLSSSGNIPLNTTGVTGNYIGAARMAIGGGAVASDVGNIAIGGNASTSWGGVSNMSIAIGNGTLSGGYGIMAIGKWNVNESGVDVALVIGCGTSANTRKNAAVFYTNGNVQFTSGNIQVQKGIRQVITIIPPVTTAYTLAEGVQHHTPEAASVYTLPAVTDATRTHECILSVKFSSTVLTYEFQDSAGNTLVPLPLNGDIEDGSVVTFYCRYEPLLSQWVIMPVMVGKEAQE